MSDHFVFPFEPLTTFGTRARLNRAVMWSVLRVNVHMRAVLTPDMSERLRHEMKSNVLE